MGLDHGIDTLNMLSLKYAVSAKIKGDATDLLKEAYPTRAFRSRFDIGVLAGCCLIHCMKQNLICVPINDLTKKLKCPRKTVFRYYKFLKEHLKKSPIESTKPEVEEFTFENKLDVEVRAFLRSVTVENKEELVKKTKALTKLAHSCWLVSGRSTENVICACAFLCWKSMNQAHQKTSYYGFCKDYSISYSKGSLRVAEVRDMLLKLGQKIPTITENFVTKKNVLFHLDYILEHSETLRNDLLPNEFTSDEIDKKEFSSFRKIVYKTKQKTYLPETEKKVDYKDDTETSDVEISDTEISSYIRSDEQVKVIMCLTKKAT